MGVLEKSVIDLANALDALESELESALEDRAASGERIEAARRQARIARERAEAASRTVGEAIDDLKSMMADATDAQASSDKKEARS